MSWRERRRAEDEAARVWKGGYRDYDLIKEFSIAIGVVLALVVLLTILFSSPDDPPSTIKGWSHTDPVDFVTTAVSELDGTSGTATYGPPYNNGTGSVQHLAFINLQKWFGIGHPINAPQAYVFGPLSTIPDQPAVQAEVAAYKSASTKQQTAWTTNYTNALAKAKVTGEDALALPAGTYGPVAPMMTTLLTLAQSGGLDGALLTSNHFYQTDYTKILMLMADGGVLTNRAQAQHLLGPQWGMMNETGSYPGQVWLWLYTFWYQIKPFSTSANGDILVLAVMGVLSLGFILIPLLPGVSDLPRKLPIYKLIWRDHYRGLTDPPPAA